MTRIIIAIVLLGFLQRIATGKELQESGPIGQTPVILSPKIVQNITICPGVVTSLVFGRECKIQKIIPGARLFDYDLDENLNRLTLLAKERQGATNMIVTIDNTDYVFVVEVTTDARRVIYTKTFCLENAQSTAYVEDLERLSSAPRLRPGDIDINGLVRIIERAKVDLVFARTLPEYRRVALNKPYTWNGCLVFLMEANAFLNSDIIVFKIEWLNTSSRSIYLNSKQVGITLPDGPVDIRISTQMRKDSWVNPGSSDTIWLVAQGGKLGYMNPFTLTLPKDAKTVSRILNNN